MSHVRTNFDSLLESNVREYSADEVAEMSAEQFDELPLNDQISIFHNHRAEYDRLTGQTPPKTVDDRTASQKAIDEYERLVDEAIRRAFHPNGV